MWSLDWLAAEFLAPLAIWVLASGLDDLIPDLLYIRVLWSRRRARTHAGHAGGAPGPEQRIAVMVPCWQEAGVIAQMLDHNLATINYQNADIWLGVYPNDEPTIARAIESELRHPQVRHVVCPHAGPTTKADNLNWLWEGIRRYEIESGERYDVIVQHDAEDLIHPASMAEINRLTASADMVQVPVFPLRLPVGEWVHGTYCDEFAEYHLKDMVARTAHGGFMPSAGVGTAYRRAALDELRARRGEAFDRESLTEDYVMGYHLRELGARQCFVDAAATRPGRRGELLATGEYFPRRFREAIRQRTRWTTGIIFQAWDQFGWGRNPWQWYWLWRDRKGAIGHPLGLLANVLFAYGAGTWGWSVLSSTEWGLGSHLAQVVWLDELLLANLGILLWRQMTRGLCTYRVYGWKHAMTAPVRAPLANLINFCCVCNAASAFFAAKLARRPLRWNKTTHAFPAAQTGAAYAERLGDALVSLRFLNRDALHDVVASKPPGLTMGEHLVRTGMLGELELYEALSEYEATPLLSLAPGQVDPLARATLPAPVAEHWRMAPYQIDTDGCLWVASPEPLSEAAKGVVARFWPSRWRHVLITQSNYDELIRAAKPVPGAKARAAAAGANGSSAPSNRLASEHRPPRAERGAKPT